VDWRVGTSLAEVLASWGLEGLTRTDMAFREWIGLLAYRLAGRTDALFPGP